MQAYFLTKPLDNHISFSFSLQFFLFLLQVNTSFAEQDIANRIDLPYPQLQQLEQQNFKLLGLLQIQDDAGVDFPLMEFSGLGWDEDEKSLIILSDRGYFIHTRPVFNGDQLNKLTLLSYHHLKNKNGKKLRGKYADSEGLALINGTQFILAHAITALTKMRYLLDLADLAGAMSIEGMQGSSSPFREELHAVRAFEGNIKVAERMRMLFSDSENMASHTDCDRVQDPYSLRCIPQVHGASRNAFNHLLEMAEIEMNSVTDNPIVISSEEAISGGGFHGQPLAMVLDYASIAAAELGNISDRRCYLMLEGLHGLPRLLTTSGGLNSGMMIPQYATAALVTENKSLCFPPSADSVPTSMGQEDHVSMGSISGRKLNQILGNLEKILAIELMYGAQAIEFRRPNTCSDLIEENFKLIRSRVAKLEEDRLLKPDIDAMIELVKSQAFTVSLDKVEK